MIDEDFLDINNTCIITEKNFNEINKLYKFHPIYNKNITFYYNKKRRCNAVKKTEDKLLKSTIYLLNKSWYEVELNATNSETLKKVGELTPELHYILNVYKEKKEKEKHQFGSLIDKIEGDLNELLAMDKT
jgi:hypothetical protein